MVWSRFSWLDSNSQTCYNTYMNKYTVEYDDEFGYCYEVVEWSDATNSVRTGETVAKFFSKEEADAECDILNAGYEYTLGQSPETEWDMV